MSDEMIINATTKSREPYAIIGLPDVGLVGSIATAYMIEELKMREIGYMDADIYHPLIIVKNGEIKRPIRLYEKDNIIAVTSDMPVTPAIAVDFAKVLINWLKDLKPRLIINVTGIPVQNRISIEKPEVLALQTNYTNKINNVRAFNDGFIMGTYASIIKECYNNNLPSLTLLAQTYLNFPDPAAAMSVLNVINELLKININLKRLEEEAEIIKLKTRELMKQTESAITKSKVGVPSIYR
ncbi:MAG: proteasome assembly chaperone family protein [Candidatus Nitrosothermus koennekii]|nr:MAG: proteasome assembly chaperone family protein [Candidatus Nitrosothermus koennekii]